MDNHERWVEYVSRNYGISLRDAHNKVTDCYALGTAERLLTPCQLRRVKHKRSHVRPFKRGMTPQVVITDEAQPLQEVTAEQVMRRGMARPGLVTYKRVSALLGRAPR
jgi:hypothetical protein